MSSSPSGTLSANITKEEWRNSWSKWRSLITTTKRFGKNVGTPYLTKKELTTFISCITSMKLCRNSTLIQSHHSFKNWTQILLRWKKSITTLTDSGGTISKPKNSDHSKSWLTEERIAPSMTKLLVRVVLIKTLSQEPWKLRKRWKDLEWPSIPQNCLMKSL